MRIITRQWIRSAVVPQIVASLVTLFAGIAASANTRAAEVPWLDDYAQARELAIRERSMLLIYFQDTDNAPSKSVFEQQTLRDETAVSLCRRYTRVRLPLNATLSENGQQIRLLQHPSFRWMNGKPGLAIVDFQHPDQPYYKHTVGCLPFERPVYYAPRYDGSKSVCTFLALPRGTLTQRMMVYAVRMHPERPASTDGAPHLALFDACRLHSEHQANIRRQGHHQWESRFHRIWNEAGGRHPVEVCAESWPGKSLLSACIDCVHSWRHSSGHWNAVRGKHPAFGYDICCGSNGIWYATGILGARKPASTAQTVKLSGHYPVLPPSAAANDNL